MNFLKLRVLKVFCSFFCSKKAHYTIVIRILTSNSAKTCLYRYTRHYNPLSNTSGSWILLNVLEKKSNFLTFPATNPNIFSNLSYNILIQKPSGTNLKSLKLRKFFSITRIFFLTVGQNNFGSKIPFFSLSILKKKRISLWDIFHYRRLP